MKFKKSFFTLLSLNTLVAPIAVVIACGNQANTSSTDTEPETNDTQDNENKPTDNSKSTTNNTEVLKKDFFEDEETNSFPQGTIVSKRSNISQNQKWGIANYANWDRTKLEAKNVAEYQRRKLTGQPYALHYHPRDLINWTVDNDADAAFARGTIPLKEREFAFKIMNTQRNDRLDILADLTKSTSGTFAGTTRYDYSDNRVFTRWSNIETIVNFGGSQSEGLFIIPKSSDINAAHKNGVPILATAFFPPNVYGGEESMYLDMITKVDDKFPVADNMVKMAKEYNFDGWFLNLETTGVSISAESGLGEFLEYLYNKMKEENQVLHLYDYGLGNKYLKDGHFDQASIDFQNRGWSQGVSDLDKVSYGFNYARGGGNLKTHSLGKSDEGGMWETYKDGHSWIFDFFVAHDTVVDGDMVDVSFFGDSEGHRDMRFQGTDDYPEMGDYYNQRTVIDGSTNFSTNFEIGAGKKYYVNGQEMKMAKHLEDNGYRNVGLQSILPTWMWIFDHFEYDKDSNTVGQRIGDIGNDIVVNNATWDAILKEEGPVYNGSTKLFLSGKVDKDQVITTRLFATTAKLKGSETFSTIVEGNTNLPKIALWLDQSDTPELINSLKTEDLGNGFFEVTYEVPNSYQGKELTAFGLGYNSTTNSVLQIDSKVSSLSFNVDNTQTQANRVKEVFNEADFIFRGSRKARVTWTMDDPSKVSRYEIYTSENGQEFKKDVLLGITHIPAAYLEELPEVKNVSMVIVAYDEGGNVLSENNVGLVTSFSKKDDMSKWEVTFNYPTGNQAEWLLRPRGNSFESTLMDEEGNLYFADDYTQVFKLENNGKLKSVGDGQWGQKLVDQNRDVKVLNLLNRDEDTLFAITAQGTVSILSKEDGTKDASYYEKQLSQVLQFIEYETILESSKVIAEDENEFYLEIKTFNQRTKQGQLNVVKLEKSTGALSIVDQQSGLFGQYVFNNFVSAFDQKFLSVTDRSDNKLLVPIIYDATGQPTELDFNNAISITGKILEFTKNSFSFDDYLAEGDIVFVDVLDNEIILVNSYGIVIKIDENRNAEVRSSLTESELSDANREWDNFNNRHNNSLTFPGIIESNMVSLDKNTNELIVSWNYRFENDRWNATRLIRHRKPKAISIKEEDFVSGQDTFANVKEIKLPTASDKKIDELRFIRKIKDFYIVGGHTGKFIVLDNDGNHIPFGVKEYKYDGTLFMTESLIFDDKSKEVPDFLKS